MTLIDYKLKIFLIIFIIVASICIWIYFNNENIIYESFTCPSRIYLNDKWDEYTTYRIKFRANPNLPYSYLSQKGSIFDAVFDVEPVTKTINSNTGNLEFTGDYKNFTLFNIIYNANTCRHELRRPKIIDSRTSYIPINKTYNSKTICFVPRLSISPTSTTSPVSYIEGSFQTINSDGTLTGNILNISNNLTNPNPPNNIFTYNTSVRWLDINNYTSINPQITPTSLDELNNYLNDQSIRKYSDLNAISDVILKQNGLNTILDDNVIYFTIEVVKVLEESYIRLISPTTTIPKTTQPIPTQQINIIDNQTYRVRCYDGNRNPLYAKYNTLNDDPVTWTFVKSNEIDPSEYDKYLFTLTLNNGKYQLKYYNSVGSIIYKRPPIGKYLRYMNQTMYFNPLSSTNDVITGNIYYGQITTSINIYTPPLYRYGTEFTGVPLEYIKNYVFEFEIYNIPTTTLPITTTPITTFQPTTTIPAKKVSININSDTNYYIKKNNTKLLYNDIYITFPNTSEINNISQSSGLPINYMSSDILKYKFIYYIFNVYNEYNEFKIFNIDYAEIPTLTEIDENTNLPIESDTYDILIFKPTRYDDLNNTSNDPRNNDIIGNIYSYKLDRSNNVVSKKLLIESPIGTFIFRPNYNDMDIMYNEFVIIYT